MKQATYSREVVEFCKCLISVFKFKLVNGQKCLDNMEFNGFPVPQNWGILPGKDTDLVRTKK